MNYCRSVAETFAKLLSDLAPEISLTGYASLRFNELGIPVGRHSRGNKQSKPQHKMHNFLLPSFYISAVSQYIN